MDFVRVGDTFQHNTSGLSFTVTNVTIGFSTDYEALDIEIQMLLDDGRTIRQGIAQFKKLFPKLTQTTKAL